MTRTTLVDLELVRNEFGVPTAAMLIVERSGRRSCCYGPPEFVVPALHFLFPHTGWRQQHVELLTDDHGLIRSMIPL